MNKLQDSIEQIDYNEEPVCYCKHCISLAIKIITNVEYCDTCGGTDIESTDIHTWNELYKNKHGVEYLKTKKDGSIKK